MPIKGPSGGGAAAAPRRGLSGGGAAAAPGRGPSGGGAAAAEGPAPLGCEASSDEVLSGKSGVAEIHGNVSRLHVISKSTITKATDTLEDDI